ncbi:MAG TPA: hypothetical protein VE078_12215, partial [Thermoanaerobaculia bacterium]|nr:hypothetical protein [Thermoanaerobaculia bacterium]
WMTGVANLFTLEYFRLARDRLAPGGIYAQWFQMYRMSAENLEVLLRTFRAAFPHAYVCNTVPYSDLLLVGSGAPIAIDLDRIEAGMARPEVREDLTRVGIDGLARLLARARLGPAELDALAAGAGPLNTDDNARIEFAAPLDFYRTTRGENERLIESVARGIAPYLDSTDLAARPGLLTRLAEAYGELAFYAEKRWTEAAAGGGVAASEDR